MGAKEVGESVKGAAVGEGVGFDGQLDIPCLNAQRASASPRWAEVGDAVGKAVGLKLKEGLSVGE